MVDYLESNDLLSQRQHGFRSSRSCLTQLLEYLFDLESALDDGDCVDTLYLDCCKAFHTVPQEHLIAKVRRMGIDGPILHWIFDFLTGREQRVLVRGCHSRWRDVSSGVPQGSVLGPTLFLVYINDILEGLHSSEKPLADDAKVYRRIRSPNDRKDLQEDVY